LDDGAAFALLIETLRPWLGHLVIVGGWAHRLHRLHALASAPTYAPIRTRDVDLALSLRAPVDGDMRQALERAGFGRRFLGSGSPPVTHYALGDEDAGFYAEFLAPLQGSEVKRDRTSDVTASKAGINVQKLRHLDVLLVAPWSVRLDSRTDVPFQEPVDILLTNPVGFIVQKLLIHDRRPANKRAQDLLYIHDTLELFGGALDNLRVLWVKDVRPSMPRKTARAAETIVQTLFSRVTDAHREAARIPLGRALTPEALRAACAYGLSEILREDR
jgi:Nucleotidyltransferase